MSNVESSILGQGEDYEGVERIAKSLDLIRGFKAQESFHPKMKLIIIFKKTKKPICMEAGHSKLKKEKVFHMLLSINGWEMREDGILDILMW